MEVSAHIRLLPGSFSRSERLPCAHPQHCFYTPFMFGSIFHKFCSAKTKDQKLLFRMPCNLVSRRFLKINWSVSILLYELSAGVLRLLNSGCYSELPTPFNALLSK